MCYSCPETNAFRNVRFPERTSSAMIKYLIRLAVTVAVGGLLLWFGIPALHARAPATYAALAANLTGREHVFSVRGPDGADAVGVAGPFWKKAPALPAAAASSSPAAPARPDARRLAGAAASPQEVAAVAPGAAPGAAVTTNVYASLADVPPGMQVGSVPPPAADDPRAALNEDPGFGWAVLVRGAPYFDKEMRRLGTLPGGSVVAPRTVVVKDGVEVASCRILVAKTRKWRTDYVVMRTEDMIRFEVPYAETDPAQRDAAIDYFTVNGRLEALRDRARAALPTNPFESEYRAAKEKYDELQTEINAVMAELRRSEGSRRQALMQRAQALRPKQVAARQEFDPVRQRWEAWESEHPDAAEAEIPETPEMRALQQELDRLRPSVSSFISGL